MKIAQAENLSSSLSLLADIKGSAGLKIARNKRMIDDELKEYYERKQELFKKYGTEEGDILKIDRDSENYPLFMEELKPLMDMEVDFNFRKLMEQELIESGMTSAQMSLIWEMVDAD